MGVKIITDSACDLPKDIIEELDIEVLPIVISIDDKEYFDGDTISPKDMYKDMRNGSFPKTAQISVSKFIEVFEKHGKLGNRCIYIAFSSELSGTYNTSLVVRSEVKKEYPKLELEIIDSKCASLGFGMVVKKAALMAKDGETIDSIIDSIKFNSKHMEHIFTVDNFESLLNGGRVNKSQAFLGEVLNIKPILHVFDGKLIPIEKVRGRNKVFKRLIEIMRERGVDIENQVIGIAHADDFEALEKLKDMITKEFGTKEFVINYMGCAIGAHTGIGSISVFFLNENE